ncbi:MAG: hypothetical protein ACOYN0_04210 [Phycisphaerales bacterium]
MANPHTNHPAPAWAESKGALATFAFWAVPTILGVLAAAALQLWVIFPRMGAGSADLDRCIALGELYREGLSDQPTVVCIGDSVSVEGIDASVVAANAPPGWRILNAALNGGDRLEQAVMLPALAKAQPTYVVWTCRAMYLGAPPADLHADRAAAYRIADFPEAWPQDWITSKTPGLTEDLMGSLTGPKVKSELHFRTSLIHATDQKIKGILKGGSFRAADAADWGAPFQMNISITGPRLDRHLEALRDEHAERIGKGKQVREYERMVELLAAAGVRPVLVVAPVHPAIREKGWFEPEVTELRALAAKLAAANGGVFIDASDLLTAEDFADGQHPGASGRQKLSALIGSKLPAPTGGGR